MYLLLNLVTFLFFGLVPAVVFCVLAGRWDVWNAWTTAGVFVAWLTFQTVTAYFTSPDLLKERMRAGPGARVRWTTARAYLVLTLVQWSIAGLDQRLHWSNFLPPAAVVTAIVIYMRRSSIMA
jgi:hypothetical protein